MKKTNILLLVIIMIANLNLMSQVAVNTDGTSADESAMLDVKSLDKGFLPPRMPEVDMYAIDNPTEGLVVYCTDYLGVGCLMVYSDSQWRCLYDGIGDAPPVASNVYFTGLSQIGSNTLTGYYTYTDAEGDLEGTSLYQWYRADDASGTNMAAISGATGITYDWIAADENKFLAFAVSPVAQTGALYGATVMSAFEGPVENWDCGGDLVDNRDGQSYGTVHIGSQCWMSDNLNVGTMVTGTQTNNSILEKYCFNADPSRCDSYGGLYQWNEMMQYVITEGTQGICPDGWHLPSDAEWCTLEQFVDPTIGCSANGNRGTDGGGKLKEIGYDHWLSPNTGATDAYGFSAIGGGYWGPSGINQIGYYWSSSPGWYARAFQYNLQNIYRNFYNGAPYGFSVRCLTDGTPPNAAPTLNYTAPGDGATDVSLNTDLGWTGSDPENDPITYDVYFGTTDPPPSVATGQTVTTYDPGTLTISTTYYWKIVAHDDQSNSTDGPVWSFTTSAVLWSCGDDITDSRDGQTYGTVEIGAQCWMAENLNIGTMVTGFDAQVDNGIIEKYCYNHDPSRCDNYGGLYDWNETMQYSTTPGVQGICPTDWHIPTNDEWLTLINSYGGTGNAGGPMKETGLTHWNSPNTGATNASGFTGIGGGIRPNTAFYDMHNYGFHWSSNGSYMVRLYYNSPQAILTGMNSVYGISVRCLMD